MDQLDSTCTAPTSEVVLTRCAAALLLLQKLLLLGLEVLGVEQVVAVQVEFESKI